MTRSWFHPERNERNDGDLLALTTFLSSSEFVTEDLFLLIKETVQACNLDGRIALEK
jgi:hypothetical protein